jgi:hypothetical protein
MTSQHRPFPFFPLLALLLLAPWASQSAAQEITYDSWAKVLERFVDPEGLVDYQGLRQDRRSLDEFLALVKKVSPQQRPELFASRQEELAFYLNAYNALIFDQVLALPEGTTTVWGKSGSGLRFFVRQKVTVGGEALSLKKLEDEWIREAYQDPRVHAALNCASLGCPRLPRKPFLGGELERQLDEAMAEFVSDSKNVRLEGDTVYLSKIFDWFESDFLQEERARSGQEATLLDYVRRYRRTEPPLPAEAKIRFLDYDKALNRQP